MDDLYIKIRELRRSKGMSQAELAKRVGYKDRSAIAKLESGHFDLSIDKVGIFAKALGTTPSYLMGWDDDKLTTLIETIDISEPDNRLAYYIERIVDYSDDELKELENFMNFIEMKRG